MFMKKNAPNTFRKRKTPLHLHHFWVIPLYPTTNETFSICTSFGFTLCSALQSHLKEVLISNVSFYSHFHFYYLFDHRFVTHSNNFTLII
mgnify:CR=1 FL=1